MDPTSSLPPDTRIALLRRSRQRFIVAAVMVVAAGVSIGVVAGRAGPDAPRGPGSGAPLPAEGEHVEPAASPVGRISSEPAGARSPAPVIPPEAARVPVPVPDPEPREPADPAGDASSVTATRQPDQEKAERRDRQRYGTVDIYSEPWANIYLGKRKVGVAPQRGVKLPVGRHRLRLVNPVLKRSTWVTVSVPSSRPVRVALPER